MTRPALVLVLISSAWLLTACGWTASGAREVAAQETCDFYGRCGAVGAGKDYATTEECLVAWRSSWQLTWPTDQCPSISDQGLRTCLAAIEATECNNLIDFLATVTKCERADVCQ